MSRGAAGETVVVKPSNNVFTWMAFAAVLLQAAALFLIYVRFPKD